MTIILFVQILGAKFFQLLNSVDLYQSVSHLSVHFYYIYLDIILLIVLNQFIMFIIICNYHPIIIVVNPININH